MLIYIAIATVLFVFAYSVKGKKPRNKAYLWMSIMLILFDGLRWDSGTDWDNYYLFFGESLISDNAHFEVGYVFVNRMVRSWTSSYTVFLVLHAIFLYGCLWLFFKKTSNNALLSLALFFALFVSYQGMNRQYLAICFCLIGFNFLVEGKKAPFVALVLIGSLFHITSFVFLFGLFVKRQYSNINYMLFILIAIVLANIGIIKIFADLAMSYLGLRVALLLDFYSQKELTSLSFWGILFAYFRRLLLIVPMLLHMKHNEIPRAIMFAFNYYIIGFVVYILFNGTALQVMVSRGNVYFMLFECILIPYLMVVYAKKTPRLAAYMVIYVLLVLNMVKGINYYSAFGENPFLPYKSIYYNTDVKHSKDESMLFI